LFIAFFHLLNHDNPDAILCFEQDAPLANPQPITGFMILHSLNVPAFRPIGKVKNGSLDCSECFPLFDFL